MAGRFMTLLSLAIKFPYSVDRYAFFRKLDRIFGTRKNRNEWQSTMERLIRTMDDPDFLSEDSKV